MFNSYDVEKILMVQGAMPHIEENAAIKAAKADDYELYLDVLASVFNEAALYDTTADYIAAIDELIEDAFFNEAPYGWWEQHGFRWKIDLPWWCWDK